MNTGDWQNYDPERDQAVPAAVQGWVGLETSMTAAVGRAAEGPITVTVRRQEDGLLHDDEAGFFPEGGPATLREVCLGHAGEPLLLARTVFTSNILRTHPSIVGLGDRPLGSLLFAGERPSPYTARQFCLIRSGAPLDPLIRWRHEEAGPGLWARRTLFVLFDAPLLVTEILLPALLAKPGARAALVERPADSY